MPATPLPPLHVGDITVTIFNSGDLRHFLRDSLDLPASAWQGRYDDALFGDWIPVPVQCALIQTPSATVLVDAPSADLGEESDLSVPGYTPPPDLLRQLASLRVDPSDITHIVITHTHFDHFNGLADIHTASPRANYPQAQLLIGRADWEAQAQAEGFAQGTSPSAQMLQPYASAGRLQLVDAPVELAPTVTVIPSPSETRGHLSVRVQSQGTTFYCIGDVYHHWVEVENRDWMVGWADHDLTVAEREKLEPTALAEDARLMASHINGIGRLVRAGDGVRWEDIPLAAAQ
ncbi:MAG: MBL fold metallo-hydrolase [Litorilinea sp.]